ncbi:MAG: YbgC/FadM family acyl-CoA thioesterase [Spirochaetales bacterium]|nr:YbgC/FadM family acyl-CoA thioesterase [Spirochaetales bacterium]
MIHAGEFREGKHHFPVRVYYSDTDAGGIIYHGRYLDMAEHARTELFRHIGGDQKELIDKSNLAFVVRSLTVDYLKPGHLDDELEVVTTITKREVFSLVFQQDIYLGDEIICALTVKAASVNLETGRPVPMDKEWGDVLVQKIGRSI